MKNKKDNIEKTISRLPTKSLVLLVVMGLVVICYLSLAVIVLVPNMIEDNAEGDKELPILSPEEYTVWGEETPAQVHDSMQLAFHNGFSIQQSGWENAWNADQYCPNKQGDDNSAVSV